VAILLWMSLADDTWMIPIPNSGGAVRKRGKGERIKDQKALVNCSTSSYDVCFSCLSENPVYGYRPGILYHFDQVSVTCDARELSSRDLTVTGPKIVQFLAKLGQIGPNYAPMKCSRDP
jgi:hypothetical protein